jgi:hypothetical protein
MRKVLDGFSALFLDETRILALSRAIPGAGKAATANFASRYKLR